ncbi:minor capsid protein [Paenibacillus timonensis]|uniref:Minor capsid protein n=2 Tax=Paenibacillus timonensis TaxID=225915 RepID=A0ABW3S878_9BACL|nr:minor capsid protein [Paenibacillus timonensis]MCH1638896.1 minor capsid protein [Paenibacillus timonensis]
MKRCVMSIIFLISFLLVLPPFSLASGEGDGNIDHGGGGMGNGSNQNFWNTHDEGVRVTIVRDSDKTPIATPVDFTNRTPPSNILHFGKISKSQYANGTRLSPNTGVYNYVHPQKELPYIIKSNRGQTSIEEIKSYFTDELVIRYIAQASRVDYDTLINGNYKLLLEPIAYITFQGTKMAMTAHEAALYDQVLSGGLRSKMVSLTHQNLPLSMFLETADLGFPAWNGSTSNRVSNDQILSSLGLGIVRFKDAPTTPPPSQTSVEYRTNTDVITSVRLSTSAQITPDTSASVTFSIMGSSLTVTNIVIPEGESQLVWVKWRTPSTPQTVSIQVSSSDGSLSENLIKAAIVDLDQNPPPDPKATDRNSAYRLPTVPAYSGKTSASWGVWSATWHEYLVWIPDWEWVENSKGKGRWRDRGYWEDQGWWDYHRTSYTASLSANQTIAPDSKSPTRSTSQLKSGYGIEINSTTSLSSNAPSSHITGAQHAISYFPEFTYQKYWRLHDVKVPGYSASFWLKPNEYSTYESPVHFTPIWFPDGPYTPITRILDAWTPAGMLTLQLQSTITISGNLFSDWHIAPQNTK